MDTSAFFEKPKLHSTAAFRWLDTPDGKRLRAARWEPVRFPKATVVILQGRGEFAEKYEEVATELTKRELRVLTLDWRGQGKSGRMLRNPQRCHVSSYDDYVADMKQFMNSMVRFATEGKLFFIAQSMGALIALHYMAKHPVNLEGMIFVSPLMDLSAAPFSWRVTKAMSHFGCSTGFSEAYAFTQKDYDPAARVFENNPWTTDKKRFDKTTQWFEQEPQLRVGGVTFGWMDATYKALEGLGKIDLLSVSGCDKLLLASPDDKVVPFLAQQRLGSRLSKCSLKTYEGVGHEILMENDAQQKQIWKDIDDFMKVRLPNYVGGGTDRIKPDARITLSPTRPTPMRPGSGRF